MSDQKPAVALSDDPLRGDDVEADHLGRRKFAMSAVDVLQSLRQSEASSVVALVGPWGGGKTSVLNMIKSLLLEESTGAADGWVISDFNPWFFQDMTTLQMAYFRELGSAIPNHGKGEKARSKLAAFGNAVAPFGSIIATLGGPDVSKSVQALSDLIAPDGSVANIHAKLECSLREFGRPVLMVLDDLDRLAPDELLLTLKLIRLIGRLPNVYYIVAYDEDTLLDCLSRTGLVGDDRRRGVDYLEKIIQVRLDVPPVRQHQLDKWIERALLDLQERYDLDFGGEAQRRLTHAFLGHMRERLTTPRAVKRYFSQVEAFLGAVHEEIDAVDFLVLTWLRTAEPLVYDMITRERSVLLGEIKNVEVADLIGKPDKDRVREFWAVRMEAARVSLIHMEGVADLVGLLFPRFHAQWNRDDVGQSSRTVPPRRIQNPNYFDRYFAFGVPPEDVSDADAAAAYQQIAAGERGRERGAVESRIELDVDNLSLVLSKFKTTFERDPLGGVEILAWIAHQRCKLPDTDGLLTPEMQSRWTAQQIYILLSAEEALNAIDALVAIDGGLNLASYLIRAAANDHGLRRSAERAASFDAASRRFADAIHSCLERHKDCSVTDIPLDVWWLIGDWQIVDPEAAASWLRDRLADGAWTLLDVVAQFVSRRRIMGVADAPWTLGDLDHQLVDRLLGLDTVLAALDSAISASGRVNPDSGRLEDTAQNRRAIALSQLRVQRPDR